MLAPPGEIVNDSPEHIVPLPTVIVGKAFMVIARELEGPLPQELLAATVILPTKELAVVAINVVVEEPDQVPGIVQVYAVAPLTATIE